MSRPASARLRVLLTLCAAVFLIGARTKLRPTPTDVPGTLVQSGRLFSDDSRIAAVTDVSFVLFDSTTDPPSKVFETEIGLDPTGVAIHPTLPKAYVAEAYTGTVKVVSLVTHDVTNSIAVGKEPKGLIVSPNGTRIYTANASSGTVSVIDASTEQLITDVPLNSVPYALAMTNDGDADDTDETIFVTDFFSSIRPGKNSLDEGQDDQREGHVRAIAAATNTVLASPNPVVLAPIADTGFFSNGRLAPAVGTTPNVAPTNPAQFNTPTGAFPNQLAAIALHPSNGRAYVLSTAASPNGPLRFDTNVHGLVSVFDVGTRTEVTATQSDPNVRRTAPLNLNQGVNLATSPADRLFFSNPVAMAWRPDGSDAWVAVQSSDTVVRLTVDGSGIPTIGSPLVNGPGAIVRVDLQNVAPGQIAGNAPNGIAISSNGTKMYVLNRASDSITVVNISNPTAPTIASTVALSAPPAPGSNEEKIKKGEKFFFTGRGRWSHEGWGSCASCHPDGHTDNVTWMFASGPRQTTSLDGTFAGGSSQRILNWTAVFDEIQDFELNTRNVSGGKGSIDDDHLAHAIGGDTPFILQLDHTTGVATPANQLANGAPIPTLGSDRRDFASATLPDGRIFIIGGRSGPGQGTLITGPETVVQFDPYSNVLSAKSSTGFLPRHSIGAGAVMTSGGLRIYVPGGYTSTSPTGNPTNIIQEYNVATNTWRNVADLPIGVAQSAVTVSGGVSTSEPIQHLNITFGNMRSEASPAITSAVQIFEPSDTGKGFAYQETSGVSSVTPRRNHGAATVMRGNQSRVLVFGGRDAAGNVIDSVQEFTFGSPTPHTSLPIPLESFGIGTSQTTNRVYIAGGFNSSGSPQSTIYEYSPDVNGPVPGPAGTPSGAWITRGTLLFPSAGLCLTTPRGVTPLVPAKNEGRSGDLDAIAAYIKHAVRPLRAPVSPSDPLAVAGQMRFNQTGLLTGGQTCASCHAGPRWTLSIKDFPSPPSPQTGLGLGNEQIDTFGQLRRTGTLLDVLINVGTFTLGGHPNEVRSNPTDVSQTMIALGSGSGFNIPTLLGVYASPPYFHHGAAQTLDDVLNGSQDGFFGVTKHFLNVPDYRQELVAYLRSIETTVAAPAITTNPNNQSVCPGTTVTLFADATSSPAATVNWQESPDGSAWTNLIGQTSTTLKFSAAVDHNGYQYRAFFTNLAGSTASAPATIMVGGPDSAPAVNTHPSDKTVNDGSSVTFMAASDSSSSLRATESIGVSAQWQVSTDSGTTFTDISGETSTSLTFIAIAASHGSRYRVVFTNACGSATTNAATLSVRSWTDPNLVASVTKVRAIHFNELQLRIDDERVRRGLARRNWSNPPSRFQGISGANVLDMRDALHQAYVAASRTPPSYSRTVDAGALVMLVDLQELRGAVVNLEE